MNVNLLFACACHLTDCNSCLLNKYGCEHAPADILLKQARKHYTEMKGSCDWEMYDDHIAERYGADYAEEFIASKAKVV